MRQGSSILGPGLLGALAALLLGACGEALWLLYGQAGGVALRLGGLALAGGGALGLLLAAVLSERERRSLRRVLGAVARLAERGLAGGPEAGVPTALEGLEPERSDELGELSRSFAMLLQRLQAQRESIDALNGSLQQRVAEADAANQALEVRVEELRRTREQLMVADRRASLGTLASGVAHEINNPLSYVLSNVQFVSTELREIGRKLGQEPGQDSAAQPPPPGKGAPGALLARALPSLLEALTDAEEGAERVKKVVRSLRIFSRGDDEVGRSVDLREVLESTITMARPEIRSRARLEEKIANVPLVRATEMQLGQVFLNLLLNAAQAIRGPVDQNRVTVRLHPERGGALVEVEDTGTGIAEEHLPRIFDPFFTTKPQGTGTGLGLSIVQGTMRSLRGTVQVRTQSGTGTCFSLWFPPDPTLTPPARPVVPAPGPLRRPRVLVIDDEPAVCGALGRLLSVEHEVSMLTDPREALARLVGGERYDAVLCDLMMPQLSGPALFGKVEREAKDAARSFVFLTGGALTPEAQAFLHGLRLQAEAGPGGGPRFETASRVLYKPVALGDLRAAIRSRLQAQLV
jgi:signal transduction histidine kinase